jgi:alpha-amylase/alpha-mannosidase (GH57 family)
MQVPGGPVTRVAILWHMHQPPYRDPLDGTHVLPWVRLHAIKDYLGMVDVLEETPGVRLTFNLVPCLLDQLEAYASGEAGDPYQQVALKPADRLSPDDKAFALAALYQLGGRLVQRIPRLLELLHKRGEKHDPASLHRAARAFSADEMRDVQVASHLAWFDRDLQERDPELRRLMEKGRGFSEEDKRALHERERALLKAIVPAYRRAAERGQVELSTSPYYHPILPLVCDSDAHHEAQPGAPLPRRFRHPEDAADQVARAVARHAAAFGAPPMGMWPPEGSVSEAALREIARAGLLWAASDEGVLSRTLQRPIDRDGHGDVHPMEMLYRPWARLTDAGQVHLLFRDHVLSDLIGFVYTNQDPEHSASDLLGRLRRIGERWAAAGLPGGPVVPLILDGENAWEHYPDGGRVFLRRLYQGLQDDPRLSAVTMREAVGAFPPGELPRVFAGSWIHANFSVWIGHADDRAAWEALGEARDALDAHAAAAPPEAAARAWESYRAACASDWWWWYGDDRSSDNDVQFDRLFRHHLESIYRSLGLPVPEQVQGTLITTRPVEPGVSPPSGPVRPVLDGAVTDDDEWAAAGVHRVAASVSMGRASPGVRQVRFGAGGQRFGVLVETSAPADEVLEMSELAIVFRGPVPVRYRVHRGVGGAAIVREEKRDGGWRQAASEARAAADDAVEVTIPVGELPRGPDAMVLFQVTLLAGGIELERHPEAAPIAARLEEG